MRRIIIASILCSLTLSISAHAAGSRPMVGIMPFHGAAGTCRHAIPQTIYWQFSCIPGVSRLDLGPIMYCIELDRLTYQRP